MGKEQKVVASSSDDIQQHKIKTFNKKLIWTHRIASIVIALISFFLDKDVFKAFFATSLVFNLYLIMLTYGFMPAGFSIKKGDNTNPLQPLLVLMSSMRVLIIALLAAFFIVKLKLSLIGMAIAFFTYKIVLLVSGLLNAQEHKALHQKQ